MKNKILMKFLKYAACYLLSFTVIYYVRPMQKNLKKFIFSYLKTLKRPKFTNI